MLVAKRTDSKNFIATALTLSFFPMVQALLHNMQRPFDACDGPLQLPPRVVQLLARRHQTFHFDSHLPDATIRK